jgi:hypothetical protein
MINNNIYLYIILKKININNNINLSNFIKKNTNNNTFLVYLIIINKYIYIEELLYKKQIIY